MVNLRLSLLKVTGALWVSAGSLSLFTRPRGSFISCKETERCTDTAGRSEANSTKHSPWSPEVLRGGFLLSRVAIGNAPLGAAVSTAGAASWQRGKGWLFVGDFCTGFIKKTWEGKEKQTLWCCFRRKGC